jgi:hypothetical protein
MNLLELHVLMLASGMPTEVELSEERLSLADQRRPIDAIVAPVQANRHSAIQTTPSNRPKASGSRLRA